MSTICRSDIRFRIRLPRTSARRPKSSKRRSKSVPIRRAQIENAQEIPITSGKMDPDHELESLTTVTSDSNDSPAEAVLVATVMYVVARMRRFRFDNKK